MMEHNNTSCQNRIRATFERTLSGDSSAFNNTPKFLSEVIPAKNPK